MAKISTIFINEPSPETYAEPPLKGIAKVIWARERDIMVEFKVVLSTKDGKSYQKIIKDEDTKRLIGLRIGDKVKGEVLDFVGYEFEITGGSDSAGFPMRRDVHGTQRKRILAAKSIGIKKVEKGELRRKLVAGDTIHQKSAQINMKVLKEGKNPLAPSKTAPEQAEEKK